MLENIEKKNFFIKIVFVSLSINRDMVLKWKLGQLVRTNPLPLKHTSFSSTPLSFDSTVITLSRDIVHKFEKLTFAGKKETVCTFLANRHHSTSQLLPLSVTFVFVFVYGLSDWLRSHCFIFAVQLAESGKMPHCVSANQIIRKKTRK